MKNVMRDVARAIGRKLTVTAAAVAFAIAGGAVQAQTRLTVYTALDNALLNEYRAAAEAALGDVRIDFVRDSTGIITSRLLAERANPRADIVWGLSAMSLIQLDALDMIEPYTPVGAEDLRPSFRSSKDPMHWTGMNAFSAAVCFNRILGERQQIPVPVVWADLLKPELKGRVSMPNPNSSGTGFLIIAGWIGQMGEEAAWEFMTELNGNIDVYTHSGAAPCTDAARGEVIAGVGFDLTGMQQLNLGAPLDVIVPTDGVGFDLEATAIVRGTRNLEAAKRLADFSVSKEANEMYARHSALPAREDVTSEVQSAPGLMDRLVTADFEGVAAQREAILAEWTRRFGSARQ
jgi:iron(III) transport system substrate-binding protein